MIRWQDKNPHGEEVKNGGVLKFVELIKLHMRMRLFIENGTHNNNNHKNQRNQCCQDVVIRVIVCCFEKLS